MAAVKPNLAPSALKFIPRAVAAKRLQPGSSGVALPKQATHATTATPDITVPMSPPLPSTVTTPDAPLPAVSINSVTRADDEVKVSGEAEGLEHVQNDACCDDRENRPCKKACVDVTASAASLPSPCVASIPGLNSLDVPTVPTAACGDTESPSTPHGPSPVTALPAGAQELDDMFQQPFGVNSANPAGSVLPSGVTACETMDEVALPVPNAAVDDCDDGEGYYRVTIGEMLDGRYRVTELAGKGVFSGVLRCVDTVTDARVAVKVIRCNDMMARAADKEIALCQSLAASDPESRKRCVRLLGHFRHRRHVCLVFEALDCDLRKLTKSVGGGVGLSMAAVRSFGKQLFVALRHLHSLKHVHADVKPDNILIGGGDKRNLLKLCDFGTAVPFHELAEYKETRYMQSRFYRAPEIPLGLPRTSAMDVWSAGCVLFEVFTGHFAFQGNDNLELLRSIVKVLGPIPSRFVRASPFRDQYFLPDRDVLLPAPVGDDGVASGSSTGPSDLKSRLMQAAIKGKVRAVKAKHPRNAAKIEAARSLLPAEAKEVALLLDLLEKTLCYDPMKRYTAEQALRHEFFAEPHLSK
jgi:serine/threonine-protein kinase PRP4